MPEVMKGINFPEFPCDYHSFLLVIWKMFYFSPTKGKILEKNSNNSLQKVERFLKQLLLPGLDQEPESITT